MNRMNRTMRKWSALLCACLLLASAPGCFKIERIDVPDAPETRPSEPAPVPAPAPAPSPEPEPEGIGFTMAELAEKNDIRRLLSVYDSVTVTQEFFQGIGVYSFWLLDGELVEYYVNTVTYEGWGDGEPMTGVYQGGWYRGLDFEVHPDQPVTAKLLLSPDRENGGVRSFDPAGYIRDSLPSFVTGEPELLEDDGKTVSFRVEEIASDGMGGEVAVVSTLVVERDTLAVLSMESSYTLGGADYEDGFTVEYGGERRGLDVMEDWEATRTVSLDFITETGTEDFDLVVPESWKLQVWSALGWLVSDEFARPGEDEYAVQAGTGALTLYVRDGANLPVDVPEPAGWDELGFTRGELVEANRITTLTKRYGTVTIRIRTENYGETTSFFRYGEGEGEDEAIVMISDLWQEYGDFSSELRIGSWGDLHFTVTGMDVAASAIPSSAEDVAEEVRILQTNADGEFYPDDLYLAGTVYEGPVSEVVRGDDGSASFRVLSGYEEEDGVTASCLCCVDLEPRLITSVDLTATGTSVTASVGEEVPFAAELAGMFESVRLVTYHTELRGETRDYVYRIPSSWSLALSVDPDAQFYADASYTVPVENYVPADGQDYELWVSTAKG